MKKIQKILFIFGSLFLFSGIFLSFLGKPVETAIVLFRDEKGNILFQKNVNLGEKVEKITPGERIGYVFVDWYQNGKVYDFESTVDENIVLTERWEERLDRGNNFVVTFYNEDDTLYESQIIQPNEKAMLPKVPTNRNYTTFAGWYQNNILFDFDTPITENIVLQARFTNSYVSMTDQDQDGIDDQTDILQNAKEYIASRPKYKSKYYANGYPDDEYGVCTDVVAFALKNAGYDLMELVNQDILEDSSSYKIRWIDKNIDFRRVDNLLVYFQKHAISLSRDVLDIYKWQGGDIVVFDHHIGVVSDKRNDKGVPYVLHLAAPYQIYFEEDILEKYEVIGHFRIS